jgi:hypothetical protein
MAHLKAQDFETEKENFRKMIPWIEESRNVKILLAFVRGSHMYGTNTEQSDVDITFVYQQPTNEILKNNYKKDMSIGGDDVVGFEIQNFMELLVKNNPNMIEALDIPDECIIYKNPVMHVFDDSKPWITTLTEKTILGYADSQIKKATGLNKKMNNPQPKERKSILDFCYVISGHNSIPLLRWADQLNINLDTCGLVDLPVGKGLHGLYVDNENKYQLRGLIKDEDSVNLRLSSIPKELATNFEAVTMYYNLDGFQVHCKDHKEYWEWEAKRNEERFNANQKAGQGVDLKNMSHLFRLLDMADNISTGKGLKVKSDNVEFLRAIRAGEYNYEDLMKQAEERFHTIKGNYITVDLPEEVDISRMKDLLLQFRLNTVNSGTKF